MAPKGGGVARRRSRHRRYYEGSYVLRGPAWVTALKRSARDRAKKYGVPFDGDAVVEVLRAAPDRCPVLGVGFEVGNGSTDWSATLDRTRPELGYVRGNIQVVSGLANRIKSSATAGQVRAVADFMEKQDGRRSDTG